MEAVLSKYDMSKYKCPITKSIFNVPVIASDGFTYELSAIETWRKKRRKSPLTGAHISEKFTENSDLAKQINAMIAKHPILKQQVHKIEHTPETMVYYLKHKMIFTEPISCTLINNESIGYLLNDLDKHALILTDVNEYTQYFQKNQTLAHLVCRYGELEHVKILERLRCDMTKKTNCNRLSNTLHFASYYDKIEICDYLLSNYKHLNIENGQHFLPLNYALMQKNWKIAELLVRHGSPVRSSSKKIENPYDIAHKHNQLKLMQMLLDAETVSEQ